MAAEAALPEPWARFLHELDDRLSGPTELHCLGGFVAAACYGTPRTTADVDFVAVRGATGVDQLLNLAGRTSALAKKHRVHLDFVAIATYPEDYERRLRPAFPGEFHNLQLMAFEPHDLALAKLVRNQDHDREDVRALAIRPGLDANLLQDRYKAEMRWQLGNPEREDLTIELWIEMIGEVQGPR